MTKLDDIACDECRTIFSPGRKTQRFCCKPCKQRWSTRDWVQRNPERAKELDKRRPPEKIAQRRQYVRDWRDKNREAVRVNDRARHQIRKKEANAGRTKRYFANHEHNKGAARVRHAQARLETPWTRLLRAAEQRAKKRSIPYALSPEWAEANWTGKCALSGIEFVISTGVRRGCFSPSIDQIAPREGYTPENSRFVLWAINAMKDVGSYQDVIRIAKAITEQNP